MLAEWNVELGTDDPILELPWSSDDRQLRFFDLKHQPELLLEIREACLYPELAEFLSWANAPQSALETAKCDAWSSRQIEAEEEVFGERCKFASYIDILLADAESRAQFAQNEHFVQELSRLLRHAPEMASAAGFTVRRCIDHRYQKQSQAHCFYITFDLHGYGEDEQQARQSWGIALKMVRHAMSQYFGRSKTLSQAPSPAS